MYLTFPIHVLERSCIMLQPFGAHPVRYVTARRVFGRPPRPTAPLKAYHRASNTLILNDLVL